MKKHLTFAEFFDSLKVDDIIPKNHKVVSISSKESLEEGFEVHFTLFWLIPFCFILIFIFLISSSQRNLQSTTYFLHRFSMRKRKNTRKKIIKIFFIIYNFFPRLYWLISQIKRILGHERPCFIRSFHC